MQHTSDSLMSPESDTLPPPPPKRWNVAFKDAAIGLISGLGIGYLMSKFFHHSPKDTSRHMMDAGITLSAIEGFAGYYQAKGKEENYGLQVENRTLKHTNAVKDEMLKDKLKGGTKGNFTAREEEKQKENCHSCSAVKR